MNFRTATLLLPLAALAVPVLAADSFHYPPTERGTVADTQFGTAVPDPYRWLEADVRTDPKVRAWVTAESDYTAAYLAKLPGRDAIKQRLTAMWNYEKFGVPTERGGRLFYTRNSGLQNQAVLYVQDGAGTPRVLLDPNTWSKDGATALGESEPSHDGKLLAYGIQDGGTDWRTIRVVDASSGTLLPDTIEWAKYTSISWVKDDSGFFYGRFEAPAEGQKFQAQTLNHKIYFHKIGTPQSADTLVYATPDRPKLTHGVEVTDDGRWLLIFSTEDDSETEVAALDLAKPGAKPRVLIPYADHNLSPVGSKGNDIYFVSDEGAPRKRIVVVDGTAVAPVQRTIVPEGKATIDGASMLGDTIIASTMEDAKSVVRRYALDGKPTGIVALPGIGSADGFEGHATGHITYYAFTSFNVPTTIYRYDAATNSSTVFKKPQTPFDASQYEVKQVFYTSKDGTRVPMFIAHKKGIDLSHGAPTLLYGYGGFDISLTPSFSVARLQWMEMGGVFALANLRGGGEYGKAWHDAGKLHNKQNVFDDFIAAGEFLIKDGVTTKDKLAINGGSNGGLLIGAVVNQRPDLFAAAIPQVGVMDMLRFNRFTAGRFWVGDYGDPGKEADFRYLLTYSPYHNIKSGRVYPAILVTTADTDDRVVPGHSFKYAATLQASEIGDKPHLIRIETRAGHGSGKPTDKAIEEYADMWAFAAKWTGLKAPE
jgi:prolyl oligopeptidase